MLNSGHETGLFPWKEGIVSMTSLNGPEMNTIQYAADGVNFEIAAITEMMPIAPGPFVPDAFADNGDGRGITWGLCHMNVGDHHGYSHCILARFDCDLSRNFNRRIFKKQQTRYSPEVFFKHGLDGQSMKAIRAKTKKEDDTILNH
ncbi:hypothetical protein [Carboxylicivirga marina]|uniref:hypothetical protein n=1 Tax=Carboxylicivirga marina TaxID=2800988 RepID=UPI00259A35A1|nr:hypothetical protein [uncultured Carboxylicivirga sp.]